MKHVKKYVENIHFARKILLGNPINLGIIILSIFLILIFFLISKPKIDPNIITIWVLAALGTDLLWGIISYLWEYHQTNERLIKESQRLPFFINGISSVIDSLIDMDSGKVKIIKNVYQKLPNNFGGVIIGAYEDDYIKILNDLLPSTVNSFFATLRGGYKPEYTIGWFLRDTMLSSDKKLDYLCKVDKARISIKVRIIILNDNEMEDFCDDNVRSTFFSYNTSTPVFLISVDSLIDKLVREAIAVEGVQINNQYEAAFVYDDYAIFDECICVKHNGRNSLYLGVSSQIKKMLLPFELLRQKPNQFKKLDQDGLYIWSGIVPAGGNINNANDWKHIFNGKNWKKEMDWNNWKIKRCSNNAIKKP